MTTINDIEQLFRSNYGAMLTFAVSIIHDGEVARDIVHDVFASLLKKPSDVITPAYLFKGVRFACLKYIRDLSTRERLKMAYALDLDEFESEQWPDEDDIALLREAIKDELTEQCKRVVKLRFSGRLSYREISEELAISEAAVYKHLRHALDVLRQKINENER